MQTLGEKIIMLKLYARKACLTAGESSNTAVGLKDYLLFLLSEKNLSPAEIMNTLSIGKSNLTHLCKSLLEDNLILKCSSLSDGRQIEYSITIKGREVINKKIKRISDSFKSVLTSSDETDEAVKHLDETLRLISFL